VSVFSGNNQPGNAGLTLEHPLVARVATLGGTPVAGAAVTFVPTSGGGSTNPAVAITDAQGLAQTTYTLAPTFTGAAIVTASSPGSGGANFNAIWRGVVTNYFPLFSSLTVTVRHSQANSPVTLVWETPPAGAPYFATPWGDVWSSIVMPTPALGGLDGLGLLGPANPTAKTPPGGPTWVLSFPSLPIFGGITFRLQAYAIDTALYPAPESIMISNAPTLTLN
jgi:hypothetical protein